MRESGILMPVSSLPGPYGIGCFGKEAEKFVDFLAAAGQKIWQILPLSPTGYGDSPYQSCSAFAGNPYFIDLDALKAEGLLTAAQLKAEPWGKDPLAVDYGTLYTSRYKILRAAYAAWCKQCEGLHGCARYYPDAYYAFTLENEDWLEDYALYMALKTANGMKSWTEWPREYRLRDGGALERFRAENEEEIGFWKFLQYEFAAQWKKVKAYANEKGHPDPRRYPHLRLGGLRGRLGWRPAVRAGRQRRLCPRGRLPAGLLLPPTASSGAIRCTTGPTTARPAMLGGSRGCGTRWASTICSASTTSAASTPTGPSRRAARRPAAASGRSAPGWSCSTPSKGRWASCPSSRRTSATSWTASVSCWLRAASPGMKVLQFAFGGGDNEYLPHNHIKNSVVYPGTHDNTTLNDWWENSATEKEKTMAAAYLHLVPCRPTAKEVAAVKADTARVALLRAALGSASDRAIIPMGDWLGLGEEAHLNTPGRLGGNWTWRAAAGFDTAALAKEIRGECEVVCRA